jgi:hypothetical protein
VKQQVTALGAAIGFGLLVMVAYEVGAGGGTAGLGMGFMLAGAALLSGGLLGFLFGIPRLLADAPPNEERDPGRSRTGYGGNTNLEQVSDWLTKILLGAGLTQLDAIGRTYGQLVHSIAPALSGSPSSVPFAGATLVFFAIVGFIAGWLTTRLLLGPALSDADKRALDQFVAAELAERSGDVTKASALRERAIEELRDVSAVARQYEESRELPAGSLRTAEMERIVSMARQAAVNAPWTSEQVRAIFEEGNPGSRIFALGLMQGNPSFADFSMVLDAIADSRSAFEQYQGLRLARMLLDGLSDAERQALREAVTAQIEPGGHIRASGARWSVAQQVLRSLDSPHTAR